MLPAVVVALSPNLEPGLREMFMPSRLEMLAFEVGITADELRGLLRRLIAAKCGWRSPRTQIACSSCGNEFELSARRVRAHVVAGSRPRCPLCSRALTPGPDEIKWVLTLPPDVLEKAVAAMSMLAA